MTIMEYVSSLSDNPYFGAGFGLFGIGNFTIFFLFTLLINCLSRCCGCSVSSSSTRLTDSLSTSLYDHLRSSLQRQILSVASSMDDGKRSKTNAAFERRNNFWAKGHRSCEDQLCIYSQHWNAYHVLWRHLDQSWEKSRTAHSGSSHGRAMGDCDAHSFWQE